MSAICLIAGTTTLRVATGLLTLAWTHSVEKTEWRETWRATPAGLELVEARIKGSGAGMDPGEGARLEGGWWVWTPARPPLAELHLARSGATADWRLCEETRCREAGELLGSAPDGASVTLLPCP